MKRLAKKIGLSEDDLINLIDECNKDINSLKIESKSLYDSWKTKVNEIGEIAVAGGSIVKLLDLRDKNIDKKLKLIAQLSTIISNNKQSIKEIDNNNSSTNEKYEIPNDLKTQIDDILNKKN